MTLARPGGKRLRRLGADELRGVAGAGRSAGWAGGASAVLARAGRVRAGVSKRAASVASSAATAGGYRGGSGGIYAAPAGSAWAWVSDAVRI